MRLSIVDPAQDPDDVGRAACARSAPTRPVAPSRGQAPPWSDLGGRGSSRLRDLESFHLYGPDFTLFKNRAPREDAAANAAGGRAMFSALEGPEVDMRELAVDSFGDVGIATFNGHFTGMMNGSHRPSSRSRQPWCSSALAMDGSSCTSTSPP